MVIVAAALVLIPGAPLVPILFLSQALNAVLLLVLLPLMRRLARDRAVMGPDVIDRASRPLTGPCTRSARHIGGCTGPADRRRKGRERLLRRPQWVACGRWIALGS